MLDKKGLQTDRWTETLPVSLTVFVSIQTSPSIHRYQIDFSLTLTHCIAFTCDVNTNTPKKPQPPPVLTALIISHSSY